LYTSVASGPVYLGATEEDICTFLFLYTPRGRQNTLSESILLHDFGIKVHKEWPPHILFADGKTVPVLHVNGLYFLDVLLLGRAVSCAAAA